MSFGLDHRIKCLDVLLFEPPLNYWSAQLVILTFKFEVVYVLLGDDNGSLLHPVVLIELSHLATHHHYLPISYI